MIENEWTYYVTTNERIAKIIPIEDQVPANNGSNTNFTLKLTQLSFYETDHLGNTRIVFSPEKFNADGSILRKIHFAADYYPYGKTLRYFETATFEEKYFTTQHERDRETGFDYRGARYYDSDLGRFLSLDPLASQYPAWSDYNYVLGNPIMLIDPDGREAKETKWTENHKIMNEAFGMGGFNELIDTGGDGDNDCCGDFFKLWNDKKAEAEKQATPNPKKDKPVQDLNFRIQAGSAGISLGAVGADLELFGWQYYNITGIGDGWDDKGSLSMHEVAFFDPGVGTVVKPGLGAELLAIGGGTLTVNKSYLDKHPTSSLKKLLNNKNIITIFGGCGYKYAYIEIFDDNMELISTGSVHSFSLSLPGGGTRQSKTKFN